MCQLLPDFLIQSWPTCCPLSQISSASHEKQLPVTELLLTEQAIRWLLRKCSSLLPDSELEQIPRSFPWPNHKVTGSSVVGFFAWPLLLWPLTASRICCRELYVLVRRFISNNGTLQVLKNPWKFSSWIWGWVTSVAILYCQRMCLAVFERGGVCWTSPEDFTRIQAPIDESPVCRLPLLSWTVPVTSSQDLDYFIADALTHNGSAGSGLHQLHHPEVLTGGSVPTCKWTRVSLLCLLCKGAHSASAVPSRVVLRGPETAWPPPGQINECCYFNEVWNLYALNGEAMLGRLSLPVSTANVERQWLQSSG